MLQASTNGGKFLLESSSQTYSNHTQNKSVSSLNHAVNLLSILLRVSSSWCVILCAGLTEFQLSKLLYPHYFLFIYLILGFKFSDFERLQTPCHHCLAAVHVLTEFDSVNNIEPSSYADTIGKQSNYVFYL